jgi:hypothetical protein
MTKTRAYLSTPKPKFIQKVIMSNFKLEDAFKPAYKSQISIFIPKLKPGYLEPCVFINVNNGRSATLIRIKDPLELANSLEKIVDNLRSDKWLDAWDRIKDVSDMLKDGRDMYEVLTKDVFDPKA